MSTLAAPVLVTVEEFIERPERTDGQYEELVDGEIFVSPNVKFGHNQVVRRIERSLLPLEKKGYRVFGEVACRLTRWSLPNTDVAVLGHDRSRKVTDDGFLEGAPELVIEVVSPGNRQLRRKAAAYLEHGAEQVWIVNPKTRRVLVLKVAEDDDTEAREGETVEFAGLSIPVTKFFHDDDSD